MSQTGTSQTIQALRKLGIHINRPAKQRPVVVKKSPTIPPPKFDAEFAKSMVEEMRLIKQRYILRTVDLVELLSKQGYQTNRGALQQVLAGNIKGTDSRTFDFENKSYSCQYRQTNGNGLVEIYQLIKKIEKSLKPKVFHLINRDMQSIMDGWFEELGIEYGDRTRALAKIVGLSHSTWFRYYQDNRYPKSIFILMDVDKRVKAKAKELKGNTND